MTSAERINALTKLGQGLSLGEKNRELNDKCNKLENQIEKLTKQLEDLFTLIQVNNNSLKSMDEQMETLAKYITG